jgi:hypothetical protein
MHLLSDDQFTLGVVEGMRGYFEVQLQNRSGNISKRISKENVLVQGLYGYVPLR